MAELSVFTNDYEWVVARDLDDAIKIVKETTGYEYDEQEKEDWAEMADDETVRIWWKDDQIAEIGEVGAEVVEKTCAMWIVTEGKGYLCTSEC